MFGHSEPLPRLSVKAEVHFPAHFNLEISRLESLILHNLKNSSGGGGKIRGGRIIILLLARKARGFHETRSPARPLAFPPHCACALARPQTPPAGSSMSFSPPLSCLPAVPRSSAVLTVTFGACDAVHARARGVSINRHPPCEWVPQKAEGEEFRGWSHRRTVIGLDSGSVTVTW